jgi:hypothetical protein
MTVVFSLYHDPKPKEAASDRSRCTPGQSQIRSFKERLMLKPNQDSVKLHGAAPLLPHQPQVQPDGAPDLIILMPEWSTVLSELVAALSTSHTIPLLEVLLLPEELDSRHLRLGAQQEAGQTVKGVLAASSPHITQFLASVMATWQVQLKVSTVTLGAISFDRVLASPLMGHLLDHSNMEQLRTFLRAR